MCYLCRAEIKAQGNAGYAHFCQTPHCTHASCGKCPLFSEPLEDDRRLMKEAALKVKAKTAAAKAAASTPRPDRELLAPPKDGGDAADPEITEADIEKLLEDRPATRPAPPGFRAGAGAGAGAGAAAALQAHVNGLQAFMGGMMAQFQQQHHVPPRGHRRGGRR